MLTRFVGWLSKVENPLVRDVSIGLWRAFADLDLSDAQTTQFRSMHDCFTRKLRDGARPIDPDGRRLTSPCDGIVGAHGRIDGDTLLQAKGPLTHWPNCWTATLPWRKRFTTGNT